MSPLDTTDATFSLSLANPNPKATRLKDGPRYRIEFEVDEETFTAFMNAKELAGMVIECEARVTGLNPAAAAVTSEASDRVGAEASGLPTAGPKGGPLSQDAAMICATEEFQDFASQIAPGFELSEDGAARCVRSYCGVRSRAELDHNPNAASRFSLLMHKYREWREGQGKA